MIRAFMFLLLMLACCVARAQVPPGEPYDPSRHVNPIVTFVDSKAFRPSTFKEAQDATDITLLGLSRDEGTLVSVEIALPTLKRVDVLGRKTDVTFYPVIRQKFKLSAGGEMTLYSFKKPKVPPPPELYGMIYQDALSPRKRKPNERRFGSADAPERLQIRGAGALLFDKDGELTLAWEEGGVTYAATTTSPRRSFFRLLEDLL